MNKLNGDEKCKRRAEKVGFSALFDTCFITFSFAKRRNKYFEWE